MNALYGRTPYVHVFFIFVSVTVLLSVCPNTHASGDYNKLRGFWQCQAGEQGATLEFKSKTRLLYNGKPVDYQLTPGIIRVKEDYGPVDYYYSLSGGKLLIFEPDGSLTQCQKMAKPSKPRQTSRHDQRAQLAQPKLQTWPKYSKPKPPPGGYKGHESDLPSLVWKFAGKWSHYTSHRETHIYLAPDGSYSETYDASFGGQFTDQGGYQAGSWGAAGSERSKGRWHISGTLKSGKIFITKSDGRQIVLNYQVHVRKGEIYWGEYFFNGSLYSVEYIYRK